jgi:hypothetical protein
MWREVNARYLNGSMQKVVVWHANEKFGVPCPYEVEGPEIDVEVDGTQVTVTVSDKDGEKTETHIVRNIYALRATGDDD